jgi:hypothetical protein
MTDAASTEATTCTVHERKEVAEATGRANMFLASVSGGLVALGMVATASSVRLSTRSGLVLLPSLEVLEVGDHRRSEPAGEEGALTEPSRRQYRRPAADQAPRLARLTHQAWRLVTEGGRSG